jgi:hypothetical protein
MSDELMPQETLGVRELERLEIELLPAREEMALINVGTKGNFNNFVHVHGSNNDVLSGNSLSL